MREEQKEEEQDKMPGKDSSLRRLRKCFKKIRRGRGKRKRANTMLGIWTHSLSEAA